MPSVPQSPSPEREWQVFLAVERANRDAIHFSKVYVDMTGDLHAGLLLSQIVYWYLPDATGRTKLRVERESPTDGRRYLWLAKKREDWWEEIRLTPKQVDRALQILVNLGIVETARFKFDSVPVVHVRIVTERFLELYKACLTSSQHNPIFPKGENPFSRFGENTNKQTTNNIPLSGDPAENSSSADQVANSELDLLVERDKLHLSKQDLAIRARKAGSNGDSDSPGRQKARGPHNPLSRLRWKQAEPRPP